MKGLLMMYRHKALIQSFVRRDLQARYKGSTFGTLWSVLHPLALLLLYTFVFAKILKIRVGPGEGTDNFAIYLLCGLLPWSAVAEGLNRSTTVLLEHASLIKRTLFPAEILPLYPVLSAVVGQLIGFALLLAGLLLLAHPLHLSILIFPIILLLQCAFTIGLAWIISGLNLFMRDLGQMVGLVLTSWSFLTPIFYPPSLVPTNLRFLLTFNPMHALIESYRSLILKGQVPAWDSFVVLGVFAFLTYYLGYRVFVRMQPAFADMI